MSRIYKFASLLAAAVMLISCGGVDDTTGKLEIVPDKTLFQSDGEDYVTLTVKFDGKEVTDDLTFYIGTSIVEVTDGKFFATEPGDYVIWASHGVYNSDPVTLRAIAVPIPEMPEDPDLESTDFKRRAMCMQFTGTGCSYCSDFMERLKPAFDDEAFCDEFVRAAVHNYQYTQSYPDDAYLQWSWAQQTLGAINPSIVVDYKQLYALYAETSADNFKSLIREQNDSKAGVACGIAVNAKLVDGQVIARVNVKAATSGTYRIGAMLLEDGIVSKQINGKEWMNTHNDCVRYIDAAYRVGSREVYYGHSLGSIEKGKTADYIFIWNLDDIYNAAPESIYWDKFKLENLNMAVFVTKSDGDVYSIVNAVDVTFNEPLPYQYN